MLIGPGHQVERCEKKGITWADIAEYNKKDGFLLIVYKNKVYQLGKFHKVHPGGMRPHLRNKGKDATNDIEDTYYCHRDFNKVMTSLAKFHFADLIT